MLVQGRLNCCNPAACQLSNCKMVEAYGQPTLVTNSAAALLIMVCRGLCRPLGVEVHQEVW